MIYREHLKHDPARKNLTSMRLEDAPNWTFGPPKINRWSRTAGAHANLPYIEVDLFYRNVRICRVNVHAHHNKDCISIGTTTHFYDESLPEAKIEPPENLTPDVEENL